MKRVLSHAMSKRWSSNSSSKTSSPDSSIADSPSSSFYVSNKPTIGLSFGSASKQGKYHKNEDVLVRPISLAAAICESSRDDAFSYSREDLETRSEFSSDNPLSIKDGGELNLHEVYYTAVFDGHGGVDCAEFLAQTLHCKIATEAATLGFSTFQELCSSSVVTEAFRACEEEFVAKFAKSMAGSCAIIALVHENSFVLAWVGDSRAVLYTGNNVLQLTKDHKTSNLDEYKRIVENGGTVINDRVLGVLSPTRAFGNNDLKRKFPGVVTAEPTVLFFTIDEAAVPSDESFLILGSDGVFDAFSNEHICQNVTRSLGKSGIIDETVKRLVEAATRVHPDDMTASLIVWNHKTRVSCSRATSSSH